MQKYRITVTSSGKVRGRVKENEITEYLGIPYGRAERFCPPEAFSWDGVLDCLTYRGMAAQPDRLGEYPEGVDPQAVGTEECLHLNLWAAAPKDGKSLPVVVYIHGGAFQVGSAQQPGRAGDLFMENDRMIFVSVEYRLGILGFLQLGEKMGEKYRRSGNCGALDVLKAVEWVHDNIVAFGGDPERVTLLGISAGAKLIGSLLTVPRMKQLCQQIVLESGAMQSFRSRETARVTALDYERILGIKDEHELLEFSAEELVRIQGHFCSTPGSTCFFGPVLEDDIFDQNWVDTMVSGRGWKGPAILGSGLRELAGIAERPDLHEKKELILKNLFGMNAGLAEQKYAELTGGESRERWIKVLSDLMYRSYTDLLAVRLSGLETPLWVYSFEYLPAVHGMGFSFLMGEVEQHGNIDSEEDLTARRRVSAEMRRAVRRFIITGIPGDPEEWPEYQNGKKRIFDRSPHMEERPEDSLTGLPEMIFRREAERKV